jgi:hypothetical protein
MWPTTLADEASPLPLTSVGGVAAVRPLATRNAEEFRRVEGLELIEGW